jgi:predicted DNA-binding transcriptional regulator AlpA
MAIPGTTGRFLRGMVMEPKEFVDTRELAQVTGISKSTWDKRRLTGNSPPYIKVGRSVRYHLQTAISWMKNRSRHSTSERPREI